MSVQFGIWNSDGRPLDPSFLQKAARMLAPYGPDGGGSYIEDNVGILFRALHTTEESSKRSQPHISPAGTILTWDGRLDNRRDLLDSLRADSTAEDADVSLVARAYQSWGTDCFARLLGDWAVSIWEPRSRTVILAKDPIGTRLLYYRLDEVRITWCTILDPLVLLAERALTLEEEYIAGWLSLFPAAHLTPYKGIHALPASCFLRICDGKHAVQRFWDFNPRKRIVYRTNGEYEEHFRASFGEAVCRRLRSRGPVLAELSGGMDSSSIVCMADVICARDVAGARCPDTVSYYDDSEPNLDERPYFTLVEKQRGRVGRHIDFSSRRFLTPEVHDGIRTLSPGGVRFFDPAAKELADYLTIGGYRVMLSGMGGDEVSGAVPTPLPELQDLIATASFRRLAQRLQAWALYLRKPWFHLLLEAARGFLPGALAGGKNPQVAPWIQPAFANRWWAALRGYQEGSKPLSAWPSFLTNLAALHGLQRQVASDPLPLEPVYEKRYPFLDRELLEFLYAVPREQLLRPGERRSLMRRALKGIVPTEVLQRKRKAFVARAPFIAFRNEWPSLERITSNMVSASLGVVDEQIFFESIQRARHGQAVPIILLLRTVCLELWLRELNREGVLAQGTPELHTAHERLVPVTISAEKNQVERR